MKNNRALTIIALCGMASSSIGLFMNSVGVFFTPIAEELGKSQGQISMFTTILTFTMAIGSLIVPGFINEKNFKKIYAAGVIVSALGVLGLAFSKNLVILYVSSFIMGVGVSGYSVIIINLLISNSFDSNIGSITGLIFSFAGIVGAVLSPTFATIIAKVNWHVAMVVMAVLVVVFCTPGFFCHFRFREPAQNNKEETFNYLSVAFIACFLMLFFYQFIPGVPQHLSNYAVTRNLASIGPLMVSACMIGNIASKLLAGRLVDSIGSLRSLLIMSCAVIVACLLLIVGSGRVILLGAAVLLGSAYAICSVIAPLLIRETFGPDKYKVTYPVIALGGNISNALALSIVGFIYDFTSSYNMTFILVIVFCIASYLLANVARKSK